MHYVIATYKREITTSVYVVYVHISAVLCKVNATNWQTTNWFFGSQTKEITIFERSV